MAALRLPLRLTTVQVGLWVGALVVFTTLALVVQPDRALSTAITLAITAHHERGDRLPARRVRAAPRRGPAPSTTTSAASRASSACAAASRSSGSSAPRCRSLGLVVEAIFVLAGEPIGKRPLRLASMLAVGGVVLLFGGAVNALSGRSVVAPITVGAPRPAHGARTATSTSASPVFDGTELGLLQTGFNQMAAGLREREHLRDLFGRHVGQEVARAAADGDVELGGETRVVTVLFVDLVGSTAYAAAREPEEVVEHAQPLLRRRRRRDRRPRRAGQQVHG